MCTTPRGGRALVCLCPLSPPPALLPEPLLRPCALRPLPPACALRVPNHAGGSSSCARKRRGRTVNSVRNNPLPRVPPRPAPGAGDPSRPFCRIKKTSSNREACLSAPADRPRLVVPHQGFGPGPGGLETGAPSPAPRLARWDAAGTQWPRRRSDLKVAFGSPGTSDEGGPRLGRRFLLFPREKSVFLGTHLSGKLPSTPAFKRGEKKKFFKILDKRENAHSLGLGGLACQGQAGGG